MLQVWYIYLQNWGDFTMGRGCKNGNAAIDPRNPTKVSSARSMSGGWLSFNPPLKWLMYGYYMVNDG